LAESEKGHCGGAVTLFLASLSDARRNTNVGMLVLDRQRGQVDGHIAARAATLIH
jgi:hypothetical protein